MQEEAALLAGNQGLFAISLMASDSPCRTRNEVAAPASRSEWPSGKDEK